MPVTSVELSAKMSTEAQTHRLFADALLLLHGGILVLQYKVERLKELSHDTYQDDCAGKQIRLDEINKIQHFLLWGNPIQEINLYSYQNLLSIAPPIFVVGTARQARRDSSVREFRVFNADDGKVPYLEKLRSREEGDKRLLRHAIQHCCENWEKLEGELAQMQKLHARLDAWPKDLFFSILSSLHSRPSDRAESTSPSTSLPITLDIYSASQGILSIRAGSTFDELSAESKAKTCFLIKEIDSLFEASRRVSVLNAMQSHREDFASSQFTVPASSAPDSRHRNKFALPPSHDFTRRREWMRRRRMMLRDGSVGTEQIQDESTFPPTGLPSNSASALASNMSELSTMRRAIMQGSRSASRTARIAARIAAFDDELHHSTSSHTLPSRRLNSYLESQPPSEYRGLSGDG